MLVRDVVAAENVIDYAARLVRATRPSGGDGEAVPDFITQWVRWGAGPRAGQSLLLAGKARAVLQGRPAVSLDDIRAVARPVLRHRILVNFQAEADGVDAEQVVTRLLDSYPCEVTLSRPHVVTSAELQSLRDLELMTKATVEGLRQGLHRSPFHGYSAEFSQYRHYRPGDDLKYVDWKAFARTDRIYTRQFRETTNLSALFVVDVSRSMDFPAGNREAGSGSRRSKFELARSVAAILGTLVLDQGDAAGVLALDERAHFVPARSGHHHLRVFLAELAALGRAAPPRSPRRCAAPRRS